MSDEPTPQILDPTTPDPTTPDPTTSDPATPTPAIPDPTPPDEDALRLAEALVFATAGPVTARALSQLLPDTADAVLAALRARYAGRGVELVDAGGGVMFRTAEDLAPRLRKVVQVPRRLPRVAMETLALIASPRGTWTKACGRLKRCETPAARSGFAAVNLRSASA